MEYADWNGNVDDSASVDGKEEKGCGTVNSEMFSDRDAVQNYKTSGCTVSL